MKVLIAIVNYKTAELVVDCLKSLLPETSKRDTIEVTVIDNDSGDDSVAVLQGAIDREGWSSWARVIPAGRNAGFSFGNNMAFRAPIGSDSPPDYAMLLNPDTCVRSGAIEELVDFMEANPKVGIAGSRLEDPDGSQQHSYFRFFTLRGEFECGIRLGLCSRLLSSQIVAMPLTEDPAPKPVDWVSGASMMVRREVFDDIGMMDEQYFLYFEETDFCLAAKRAGWQSWTVPASRVIHFIGKSTGVTSDSPLTPRRPRYWFESRRRFFKKNHGIFYALLADLAALAGCVIYHCKRVLLRRQNHQPVHFVRDLLAFNADPTPRDTPLYTSCPSEKIGPRAA